MSTNYYGIVTLPTMSDEDEDRVFRFHIGKTGAGTIVSGNQFASFAALVAYLRHTGAKIVDEYRVELSLDELRRRFENYPPEARRRQYDFVAAAALDAGHLQHRWCAANVDNYWVDDEGYTLCRGAFS